MSRSRKKYPIGGIANVKSEKQDKKILHGVQRSQQRQILTKILKEELDSDEVNFYNLDEALNQWDMSKDGKIYYGNYERYLNSFFDQESVDYWKQESEKALRK